MKKAEAEHEAMSLPDGWLIMEHPELEDSYSTVQVVAFEEVYKDLGWEKADLVDEDNLPYSWNQPEEDTAPSTPNGEPASATGEEK